MTVRMGRRDVACAFSLAILIAAVAMTGVTRYHSWGDDFAGYVLQARALGAGNPRDEVRLNGALLAASDGHIGPSAYPWGFPALLWLAAQIGGWGMGHLKMVGVVSLALCAFFSFLISRLLLSRHWSVVAVALVGLQPELLQAADSLSADLPFLALSTATIFCISRAYSGFASGRMPIWAVLAGAVLTAGAFTLRSNGALLAVAFLAASGILWVRAVPQRKTIATCCTCYASLTLMLTVLYFALLPDGSLDHITLLKVDVRSMMSMAVHTAKGWRWFLPYSVPSATLAGCMLAATSLLVAVGIWAQRQVSLILVMYGLLTGGLLLMFPFPQGGRYLLPLLLPTSVFGLSGIERVFVVYAEARMATISPIAAAVGTGMILCTMAAIGFLNVRETPSYISNGPYSEATQDMVAFIKRTVPPGARVSFFKPRAMRLLTGYETIRIWQDDHLECADYYVISRHLEDLRRVDGMVGQPAEASFTSHRRSPFESIFENEQFAIYKRGVMASHETCCMSPSR